VPETVMTIKGPLKNVPPEGGRGSDGVRQSVTAAGSVASRDVTPVECFIGEISSTLLTHIICVYRYLPSRYQG